MAFGCCVRLRIDVNGVVGAGLHACLAADADARIELDDSVFPLVHGAYGADMNAWRVRTVVAACDLEKPASVWESTFFCVLNPGPIYTQGNFIFRFTCSRAGVAADTFTIVNDKSEIRHLDLPVEGYS